MAADLTAFDRDPLDCELDELPGLRAAFTLVAGKPLVDSAGLFADAPAPVQEG